MTSTPLRSSRRTLIALVGLAFVLAGCSFSGDSEGAGSTTAPNSSTSPGSETTETPEATDAPATTVAPATTAGPSGGDADVCTSLKRIADFDAETGDLVKASAEWSEVQAFFAETAPDVLDAYDDGIAAGPDLADELTTLRDFTAESTDLVEEATSLLDFGSRLEELTDFEKANQAGMAVSSFAEQTCGFPTAGF